MVWRKIAALFSEYHAFQRIRLLIQRPCSSNFPFGPISRERFTDVASSKRMVLCMRASMLDMDRQQELSHTKAEAE